MILFNVENTSDSDARKIMDEGERILSTIPGVRRVVTGTAVQEAAGYKYTWLIEFAHRNVIASYRDHPEHMAFANNLFRPIAGDRISIDFLQT